MNFYRGEPQLFGKVGARRPGASQVSPFAFLLFSSDPDVSCSRGGRQAGSRAYGVVLPAAPSSSLDTSLPAPPLCCRLPLPSPQADDQPFQVSSANFTRDAEDAHLLATLRAFVATDPHLNDIAPEDPYLRTIGELRPAQFADVVCKVVAEDDSDPAAPVLFAWDGTDAEPHALG